MPDINKSGRVTSNDELYYRPTRAVPSPRKIDTQDIVDDIIDLGDASKVDTASISTFTSISQQRDQLYSLLDVMAEDSRISAVLETYVEDATQRNDRGNIVWCESTDERIQKFVQFLLSDLSVDRYIYGWTYQLCKYGDLYLRLYHTSDVQDNLFKGKDPLQEDVKIRAFSPNDKYVHHVQAVNNPAEIFELIRFGKTAGYIQAPVISPQKYNSGLDNIENRYSNFTYAYDKNDVTLFGSTEFVHAALEDTTSRTSEEVRIFNTDEDTSTEYSYTVRRGQSLLYDAYRIWREVQLMENAILLNRITKSSVVRIVEYNVGDMPKEQVPLRLSRLKSMIEQKSSFNEAVSMSEYTNPGPVDNTVYIPVRGDQGGINITTLGGDDVNIGQLTDLDYFKSKLFGALKVPKQYFGDTDDSGGFDGGTSLSIIDSRYAKTVKRIQSTMCQAITDLINIYLLDKHLDSYIGKFTIHMLPPTTREDMDRRENLSSKVQLARDIMDLLPEIEGATKLKLTKSLLSSIVDDPDFLTTIQDEIDIMESSGEDNTSNDDFNLGEVNTEDNFSNKSLNDLAGGEPNEEEESEPEPEQSNESLEEDIKDDDILPDMSSIDIDFTDNTKEYE